MENVSNTNGILPSARALALVETLKNKKGQNMKISWSRPLKTYKGDSRKVVKSVECVMRTGVEYDNIQSVKAKREGGELPEENQGTNGKQWLIYPFVLVSLKSGKELLRLSKGTLDFDISSTYEIDGKEATKEECKAICLASEFSSRGALDCLDITLDNVTMLG
jgi:hypothetical protein